jgi:uncharacterized membrane protein required for colicin V production
VELVQDLSWVDLAIIVVLAVGVFAGFTQGTVFYVLNCLATIIAFIVAAQLKAPLLDLLGFWRAFSPEGRELIVFIVLWVGLTVGAWLVIWATYRRTRLPLPKQIDEIGGAVFGLLYVALVISLQLLVLDSFYLGGAEQPAWLRSYYDALNDSLIVGFLRDTLIPVVGFVMRPFVPDEIAELLS